MSPAKGVRHSALADISLIRQNLHDRYYLGFPILKELAQNADDARAATLDIGWIAGLSDARHPLLQGPGIFVANDAAFKDSDAQAIRQLGLSDQAADTSSVGKFGLGLKSVFHLCEAFFYLAAPGPSAAPSPAVARSDIFNPYSDGSDTAKHQDWDEFCDWDQAIMRAFLASVLGAPPEFCLWIPLRREQHCREFAPIATGRYGDEQTPPDEIFLPHLDREFAQLLPLFRNLRSIRTWLPSHPGEAPTLSQEIRIGDGSSRRSWDGVSAVPFRSSFGGEVIVSGPDRGAVGYRFAGSEALLQDDTLAQYKKSEFWPKLATIDPETLDFRQHLDKAEPHALICFHLFPAAGEGALSVSHAVFLPTGEPETLRCAASVDFALTLHGYFFLDAGRRVIDLSPPETSPPTDQLSIRRAWNRELKARGTLRLLVQALGHFVREAALTEHQVAALTRSLADSLMFRDGRAHICADQQWAFLAAPSGDAAWGLFSAQDEVLELPPTERPQLAQEVFPALRTICHGRSVTFAGAPRLTHSGSPGQWTDDLLLKMLDLDIREVCRDVRRFDYLLAFMTRSHHAFERSIALQEKVLSLARQALRHVELADVRKISEQFQAFVEFVPSYRRFVVGGGRAAELRQAAMTALSHLDLQVLIVPEDLVAPATGNAEQAECRLSTTDAFALLALIQSPPDDWKVGSSFASVRDLIALRVVAASRHGHLEFVRRCGGLEVFTGHDFTTDQDTQFSINQLQNLKADHTLFIWGAQPRSGLAGPLSAALTEKHVVLIDRLLADGLFPGDESSACTARACLQSLSRVPSLSSPEARLDLIGAFRDPLPEQRPLQRQVLRYLMHSAPSQFNDNAPLLCIESGADEDTWTKVAREVLRVQGQTWRMVSGAAAAQIPTNQWEWLGLSSVDKPSAQALLSEVDRTTLDLSALTNSDRDFLLREVGDHDILKQLPIHETTSGTLTLVTEACYLESGLRLDPAFAPEIVLIRRNTDPWLAHRQGQIIPQLDAANVIRIALRSAAPAKRWQGILAAAAMLNDQELLDLRGALASTAWLPLTNGSVAKAEDFIFVSEIEEEVSRVVADSGGLFHEVLELEAAVRSNEAFPRLALAIFPARETALMMLGEMMSAVDKYRIGALDPSTFDLSAFRVAFSQAPWHLMPAFTVLDSVTTKLSLEACENHLLPNLMREISLDRTGEILSYLSEVAAGAGSAQASATRVFNWYLSSIVRRAGFMQILATLRLKSRKGTWKAAAQLCPLAQNIRDDDILDAQQESILRPAIGSPRIHPQDASSTIDHVNELARLPQDWEERVERAADTLGNYFDRWEGRIQPEVIGGFLSLLGEGPGLDKLVSRFLGNRTVPGTRAQLGWVQLEGNIGGAGEDAQTVMARYRFMVDLVESDTVSLSNLLGQPFQARLGEQVTNIVVGDPFFTSLTIPGKNLALQQIFLRMIDPDDYQESELSSILQDSAEYVLRRVYLQSPDLGELWSELSESEQLDIGVARNLLLDQATFYLRQLGVQRYEPIAAALAESDAARRLEAEEESLAKSSPRAADTAMQKARARLRAVLESDVDAQRAVLTAVRRKLEDDQYKPKSVPFELFQNADDAAVELAEMMGDAPIPVEVSRFVVLVDDQSVMFAHWGRRINQYNSGGFSGRGRGFDRDLEKMLTLSASDKFNSVGTPHAVTGKFGLGFKSTLLVSDRPIVMSGRLAFEVVGGIYPKKLEPSERQRISTRLESGERMEAQRDATVICLPLTEKAQTDEILARFTTAAPLLLAFSRRIKSIDLQEANGTWLRTSWKEYDVPRARGVTTGRLGTLAESSREHTIGLRIACSSGSLLFALGPRGFRALPLDLPTIWATTPTEHVLRLGFCINGPFAVDVGRTLLARESQANVELVDEMGHDLAHRFESLVTAASDWPDFTMSLGLAPDLSAYDLWDSLWDLLATNLSQTVTRSQPDHAQALVLRLLWPDQGPIERFVRRCRVLPTKLWSTHRTLTRADEVQWTATGTLDEQDVFTEISGWQAFTSRVTSAQIVSDSRVAATLRSLKSLLPASWRRFTLVDVMTWALNDGHLVEPELSAQFGRVLTKELVATLKGGNEAQKREYEDIQELLSKLVFRAEDGRLRSANELLIPGSLQSEHRDESRRAAFAPESKKLAADYGQSALPFFELCRSGLAAPSKEMAEWAFSATDPETRCKVLEYLLDGERASPLARDLRTDGRWSWLNELATSPLLERFDPREARLPYDLWLDTDTDSSVPAVMTPTVDAGVALNRIHEWWRSVAKDRTERYERRVYLDGKAPPLSSNLDCLSDFPGRSNWLQLLLLGAMHTIGRTSPEQHRGFLRLCRDEGWIDIFAAPTVDAEAWMRVIEDYLNQQVDDSEFSHWMKQFVGIFQVSRWLNEYAELFVQADRLAQPVQLDAIISPRASSDFQGSGLDAPPLGRTLGIGACFVMRELFRAGALSNPTLHRHCYVPAKPVRRLLVALGSSLEIDRAHYRQSEEIHKFLVEHLGPERATFGGSFDLPLLALSDDPDLQMEFLKFHLPEEIDDSI